MTLTFGCRAFASRKTTKRVRDQGDSCRVGVKCRCVQLYTIHAVISAEKEYSSVRMEEIVLREKKQLLLNKLEALNAKNDK